MRKKPEYKQKWERDLSKGVSYDEKSLTVPNMDVSIPELIRRSLRGEALPIGKPVHFDGEDVGFDDVLPTDMGDFDISDADNELRRIYSNLKEEKERKEVRNEDESRPDKGARGETGENPVVEGSVEGDTESTD